LLPQIDVNFLTSHAELPHNFMFVNASVSLCRAFHVITFATKFDEQKQNNNKLMTFNKKQINKKEA